MSQWIKIDPDQQVQKELSDDASCSFLWPELSFLVAPRFIERLGVWTTLARWNLPEWSVN